MGRIADLPRRNWRDLEAETVEPLSACLRTAQGEQTLRPLQAVSIREAAELGGAYVMGRVGIGKTLITLLAGEFMREERVLILVPGGDKAKTEREFDGYRVHWNGINHARYKLLGYSDISRFPAMGMSIGKLWGGLGPTLIICDEADRLRRVDPSKGASALAMQISDYLDEHQDCKLIALTGTPEKESIKDYAHILLWCLGKGSPLPTDPEELEEWSSVLDKGDMTFARKLCNTIGVEYKEDLLYIQEQYNLRLRQTPGVVISDDQFGGPLTFRCILVEPDGMDPHFVRLRKLWQRPDGWDLTPEEPDDQEERRPDRITNGSIWACARQEALGFCYVADPVPPEDWMQCRREYFQAVRASIAVRMFYAHLQFKQAGAEFMLPPRWQAAYDAWQEMGPTFTPGSRPLWLSNHALDFCQDWGEQAPGIIWVDHEAFGAELSRRTGWRFHQAGGKDRSGKAIDRLYKVQPRLEHARETVIASRFACGTGRNLQAWNRHLVTAIPANNRDFEQMVGRSHRELQDRPVQVDIMMSCREHFESLQKVLDYASKQSKNLMQQKATLFPWIHVDMPTKGPAFND